MGKVFVTFRHPRTIVDKELKTMLGQEAAQKISHHTQKGLNANGYPMKQLGSKYASIAHGGDRTRRLTVTGKMLLSSRLRYARRSVSIIWLDPKAAWHQNKNEWIGLSDREKKSVSAIVRQAWRPKWDKNLKEKKRSR